MFSVTSVLKKAGHPRLNVRRFLFLQLGSSSIPQHALILPQDNTNINPILWPFHRTIKTSVSSCDPSTGQHKHQSYPVTLPQDNKNVNLILWSFHRATKTSISSYDPSTGQQKHQYHPMILPQGNKNINIILWSFHRATKTSISSYDPSTGQQKHQYHPKILPQGNKKICLILNGGSFFFHFLQIETQRSKQWPTARSRQKLTSQSHAPYGQLRPLRKD